ncbi:MAG: hypothetical protein ACPGQL_10125 [Thermoplasmatota archaeon]
MTGTQGATPLWLYRFLERELPAGTHVLNARAIERGRFRGAWLANTSRGAALVTRNAGGEPRAWHLEGPGHAVSFTCKVCDERMAFADPELPKEVFCSNCGTPYLLDEDGVPRRAGQPSAVMPAWSYEMPPEAPPAPAPSAAPVTPPEPAAREPEPKEEEGPFTHSDYTLYSRETDLRGGGTTTLYFFAKKTPKSGEPCAKPDGYSVGVNDRTGLPFLRRDGAKTPDAKASQKAKAYRPQCQGLTPAGAQCRNSARSGSKYCASHKGYRPPAAAVAAEAKDTLPRVKKAEDTAPSGRRDQGLCTATTAAGNACRNRAQPGKKVCGKHGA